MAIEQQTTADTSENSGEFAVHKGDEDTHPRMASRKQRTLVAAGIFVVLALAVGVSAVAMLVGKSFSGTTDSANEAFDFSDVGQKSPAADSRPTQAPTIAATDQPTAFPSGNPSIPPTQTPSLLPSEHPSLHPSQFPTLEPTPLASESPTNSPAFPTAEPTRIPTSPAPINPVNYTSPTLLTFCVIADVPYFRLEERELPKQIRNQMDGCEFLVHLGDIMKGEIGCDDERYVLVKDMMLESTVPAFIVPGDNEWNDCGNRAQIDLAWGRWTRHFMQFENNWNHTFAVTRNLDYRENFYFIKKRTLVFGLNIVGGRVHDEDEWFLRLSMAADWVKEIVEMNVPLNADGVIIMAHAKPTEDHSHFFRPLRDFVRTGVSEEIPFLYLHGDGHDYVYSRDFLNRQNFIRIQHEGGVRDPILKILADPQQQGREPRDAFQVDRQLYLERA